MRINISDRQLHQNSQTIETFHRFDIEFDQNHMHSFIRFVLRINLDFSSALIIRHKSWGIPDKCALNKAASFLPRMLFGVELESHNKHDQFVNIRGYASLLCQSLQIGRGAWCIHLQSHFPDADIKAVCSRHGYLVWRVDDQESGIGDT